MDFVTGAREVLLECDLQAVAIGFEERLRVAADSGRGRSARSLAAPFYLTDLGVRRFEDPALFFAAHLERFGWHGFFDAQDSRRLLTCAPLAELAGLLDALVLLTGDYSVADEVVRAREAEILGSEDHVLLLYAGVILASRSDPSCRQVFDAAAAATDRVVDTFMAQHRRSAAEIKKLGDVEHGLQVLGTADDELRRACHDGRLGAGDLSALTAVSANLRAFAFLRLGHHDAAAKEVVRSRSLSTHEGLEQVMPGESARYASQESINVAQTKIASGDLQGAVTVLHENVEFAETFCSDYLSEALSAYAYGLFLASDHVGAARVAREVEPLVLTEASPRRLRTVREVLVASLAESGAAEEAARVLARLREDPIGLGPDRTGGTTTERRLS